MRKRSSIVLSRHPETAYSVTSCLEHLSNSDHIVRVDPPYEEIRLLARQESPLVVVADLRPEFVGEQTEQLLREMVSGDVPPLYLCGIRDQFLPRSLAGLVEPCVNGYMESPCNPSRIEEALAPIFRGEQPAIAPRTIERETIQSGDVSLFTYTPKLFPVIEQVRRVAVHDVTLLFIGETGTGKTTLARIVHNLSDRKDEPFHNVACGAIPKDLIESDLFGHVRGAFTGAERSKIGRFEAAGHGSLLLDEIDVLSPREQAKLLRIIETGEFEPVGSPETRFSHARLLVASNVDLETLTQRDQFRSDLFYRLNVLEFRLLPLRERPLDIVPLAVDFIDESCRRHGIRVDRIHRDFLECLKQYSWPGNLRELKNQVQRAVLFCENRELTVNDLSPTVLHAQWEVEPDDSSPTPPNGTSLAERVAGSEREILEKALQANGFKRTATAKALGISRVGLYKKMRKYGMLKSKGSNGSTAVEPSQSSAD